MPEAETLNCPMCGASASTDATRCEHCGARLATIACPSCFGMMFIGAKFCSHCGARVDRTEVAADVAQRCPRCRAELSKVVIGNTNLKECPRCEGIWVDTETLQQICIDRERQGAMLGKVVPLPKISVEAKVQYVPCPICGKLMNRVNFAQCSHVVVDVCIKHGTWFDRDELRRIVEFIRAGGLDVARAKEMEQLEQRRRELTATQTAGAFSALGPSQTSRDVDWGIGLSAAAAVLKFFLK